MKTAVRWIRRLLDMALILLVVSILGLVLASSLGPGLGHQLVVIRGGSMSPAIPLGALVDVARTPADQIRAGDVVAIAGENGVLVTHRVVRVAQMSDGLYFATKGDANDASDPVMEPASSVQGRVDLSIPGMGYVLYLLTLPMGVVSILCLALMMLLAIWLLEDFERGDGDGSDLEPYESDLARSLDAQRTREYIG
jgi:signal peptidase I